MGSMGKERKDKTKILRLDHNGTRRTSFQCCKILTSDIIIPENRLLVNTGARLFFPHGERAYFSTGPPDSVQALQPPAMERTWRYPIFCRLSAARAERKPPPQ